MTNGEKILNVFSTATIRRCKNEDLTYIEVEKNDKWIADFDIEWWNAEYKEPTTKNNLVVDKLIADCEKMSFDIEIFNKPLKVVALDAVKNIVKDLSSVIPQEPTTSSNIPFIMHKEMDIPISECQKAYDVAMEYLRSQAKVKG